MNIRDCDFYKTVNTLADFANLDTTVRLNHSLTAWCDYDDSGFLPHETLLGKTMNIMMGITSSLSYMRLSITQVSHSHLLDEFITNEFQDYDIYRYHYIVFSHSIALLQDLLFKLTSTIWGLNVTQRMIGWNKLEKELKKNDLTHILLILENFYNKFSKHIKKRNKFSHEGLLSYNSLDNFHLTYICTNLLVINESKNQQYIRGTQENIELLQETKEKFIKELNQLLLDAEQCVMNLYDLCLDKLLSQIDYEFMKKHSIDIKECNNKCLSEYLVRIGL
jgi:hypothetical protein